MARLADPHRRCSEAEAVGTPKRRKCHASLSIPIHQPGSLQQYVKTAIGVIQQYEHDIQSWKYVIGVINFDFMGKFHSITCVKSFQYDPV